MPYNAQFPPAEWDQMTRIQRQKWRKVHWRPHGWMVEAPLKREATRQERREGRRGGGLDLGGLAKAMGF